MRNGTPRAAVSPHRSQRARRPETELSHYFQASLPAQFDEYVWFDRSRAVAPLDIGLSGGADTYPFGL